MSLNDKQQAFVREYLIDLNATQAAIRAGYSEKTARAQGARLLTDVNIAAAIAQGQADRAERVAFDADRVLLEIGRIATSDLRRAFNDDGGLKNPSVWDDDTAAAISSVKVVTRRAPGGGDDAEVEYVTELKLWDKNSALEKAGKHLGMFREQIDVNVKTDLAAMIAARRRKVAGGDGA